MTYVGHKQNKNVIEKLRLRTTEHEQARDERCQSPSSLAAERDGIGGIFVSTFHRLVVL